VRGAGRGPPDVNLENSTLLTAKKGLTKKGVLIYISPLADPTISCFSSEGLLDFECDCLIGICFSINRWESAKALVPEIDLRPR